MRYMYAVLFIVVDTTVGLRSEKSIPLRPRGLFSERVRDWDPGLGGGDRKVKPWLALLLALFAMVSEKVAPPFEIAKIGCAGAGKRRIENERGGEFALG